MFFIEFSDDFHNTSVDAGEQTQESESNDNRVFPQAPVSFAQSWFLPVGHQVDAARQDQTQKRQAQCSDERYDRTQFGYGDRDGNWRQKKKHPDEILSSPRRVYKIKENPEGVRAPGRDEQCIVSQCLFCKR